MENLLDTSTTALINASHKHIDLFNWLFSLNDEEYKACSKAHLACGSSQTADGQLISVNVELVGDNLLIQHYVPEITKPDHCRVNSLSNSFASGKWTTMGVTWELTLENLSESNCLLRNRIIVSPTDDLLDLFDASGITDIEPVKYAMLQNAMAHNEEETPLFAKDIERKANAGRWV